MLAYASTRMLTTLKFDKVADGSHFRVAALVSNMSIMMRHSDDVVQFFSYV